ncbi:MULTISPECIES: COQ9 family protein [Sphingobium]|uniref:COQ9 family protein n=1 Tax=Sphingobium TaxID=165695 RepID=UPI0015EC66E7|nr:MULTISPECIES: COQ9 family protein [Sphingobium]MCW2363380.1 ubiquinone biosynthesis protein COQ9 [Sphingobium sp. B10D3B]MCW2403221.1 ubiquinone biosynthesis protein COQ9 [Sphingobium sp. B10D7B]MCW2410200.1 ubiquinone biosynthesis protein COQ9 [Sphingobium xanthum]
MTLAPSTAAPQTAGLLADETLDDLRLRLAPLIAANAAFDGWSDAALAVAADTAGVDRDVAALAFSGGALTMIDAWFASVDQAMLDALPADRLAAMKIRERITALVEARLAVLAPNREALRRAQAVLAMPLNLPRATRLGWRAADAMWRAAGDRAVDYNHYSKRTTLAGVYAATLLVFVNDESTDYVDTRAFLARRIEGIMRFEKAKGRLTGQTDQHFSMARFLGRLRYRGR